MQKHGDLSKAMKRQSRSERTREKDVITISKARTHTPLSTWNANFVTQFFCCCCSFRTCKISFSVVVKWKLKKDREQKRGRESARARTFSCSFSDNQNVEFITSKQLVTKCRSVCITQHSNERMKKKKLQSGHLQPTC